MSLGKEFLSLRSACSICSDGIPYSYVREVAAPARLTAVELRTK